MYWITHIIARLLCRFFTTQANSLYIGDVSAYGSLSVEGSIWIEKGEGTGQLDKRRGRVGVGVGVERREIQRARVLESIGDIYQL